MKSKQLPSLNGWRAVAILLVLAGHSALIAGSPLGNLPHWQSWFNGVVGVRFFFTISGFLITWLLLQEEAKFSRISLKNFYIRRTLRIWPVYFFLLLVLAILQVTGIAMQPGYAWRGLLTFTRNYFALGWMADQSMGSANDLLSLHCWSLSIEEQFYFSWPLVFCLTKSAAGRFWFLAGAILFSAGFKTVYVLGFYPHGAQILFQDNSTFLFLDCLAWGCLAAILLASRKDQLTKWFRNHGRPIFLVSLGLVMIPYWLECWWGIQALGFTVLLLHSVLFPDWIFYRVLNFKWINRIGVLSYSLYIWQQLVCGLWPRWLGSVWFLWLPLAFGIAWVSYQFLEKPFISLRARLHDPNVKISTAMR